MESELFKNIMDEATKSINQDSLKMIKGRIKAGRAAGIHKSIKAQTYDNLKFNLDSGLKYWETYQNMTGGLTRPNFKIKLKINGINYDLKTSRPVMVNLGAVRIK